MRDFYFAVRALLQYPDYAPQPLTIVGVRRWIKQFKKGDRRHIWRLVENVVYLTAGKVRDILIEQNSNLTQRLMQAGLRHDQFVYVQVHDAGSSSGVMVNLLRDTARLKKRCHFIDSRDTYRINDLTNTLGEGALIYVDDFVGSGQQLCDARDFAIQFVNGSFSEFVLVPSICEEGRDELTERGIEVFSGHLHQKAQRPLHANSTLFDATIKARLCAICEAIDGRAALGFQNMAAMVVLYRNAPDNVPVLLRGSPHQDPCVGLFPRTTDLPIE
jgi:hypothetical protein